MKTDNNFYEVFGDKPPRIGMLHLSEKYTEKDPVPQALKEIEIYEEGGFDAIIVENYHGSTEGVEMVLQAIQKRGTELTVGINILPNEYQIAFDLAEKYDAKFIQLDYVAGEYNKGKLNLDLYKECRKEHQDIAVLGGVWPKYYKPLRGSDLEKDLHFGMELAEAIVVTGSGTGVETPIEKIQQFREIIDDFPLIVGAGVTAENASTQLYNTQGVIVGSSLKPNNDTSKMVDPQLIKDFAESSKDTINTNYVRNVINHKFEETSNIMKRPDGIFGHYAVPINDITSIEIEAACDNLVEHGFLETEPNPNDPKLKYYRKKR